VTGRRWNTVRLTRSKNDVDTEGPGTWAMDVEVHRVIAYVEAGPVQKTNCPTGRSMIMVDQVQPLILDETVEELRSMIRGDA
jgi:hypothetical protein